VPRVLIVDDDLAEISAVKRVLARAGHQSLLATNTVDAVSAAARTSPAILVVSATTDGGQALKKLVEEGAATTIPTVVLGESAGAPGGATQVPRPIDPAVLADALSAALRAGGAPSAPAPAAPVTPAAPATRKAAADALRARAEELRRGAVTSTSAPAIITPPPPSAIPPLDLFSDLPGLDTPDAPAPDVPASDEAARDTDRALDELAADAATPGLDPSADPGLEAILRRAEDAERAHAAQQKARAVQDADARRAKAVAARAAEAEAIRQAEASREAETEARRAAEEEARRAAEAKARRAREAEARRAREAEDRRASEAEERVRTEQAARESAEGELQKLRRELEEERRAASARAEAAAHAAAQAATQAAADDRRDEEEQLRAAIESARAEMETLRRRGEDEARRRAEAEAEVARLAQEAAQAERRAREAAEAERRAREAATMPAALEVPVYHPPAKDPVPDPVQESARRRVAALRGRAAGPDEEVVAPDAGEDELAPAPMRPPPPELRSGTLSDLPAPRVLALVASAQASGRLDFEGDQVRSLWFRDGRITGAASAAPSERVDELALRLGLLTREQHRLVAVAAAPLSTRRAAVMLVERGFMKPAELAPLVRRRTEEVVFGLFGDAGARFRWAAGEAPPDESTALERTTLQLAVEGVRRRWLAQEVDAVLGGDATLLSRIATGPGAADLGLSPEEKRVLALADGLRTLDEIQAASPLDPLSTCQALAAMVLVGTLAVRTFQGGRPAAQASAAIDLARVRDKLDQVRRADYFTILGLGRLCTPHEVREAYERLRSEFDPRRYHGLREDGLLGRLDEIQRVVADARDVLADDRLRAEYLRGLGE
jgi:hypothetical protein